ncbi:MAG: hypothetical protein ACI9BF_000312 [Candidatus Paceibacteria bacterium]|jgi:hypothetical protein
MSHVIAISGEPSYKEVNGEHKLVVPFVGADRGGESAQMGIGLLFPDEGNTTIMYLAISNELTRLWRGMKLLEQVTRIKTSTLCDCWTIATSGVSDSDKLHLEETAYQFGGMETFEKAHTKVLTSVPIAEDVKTMVNALREMDVGVATGILPLKLKLAVIKCTIQRLTKRVCKLFS